LTWSKRSIRRRAATEARRRRGKGKAWIVDIERGRKKEEMNNNNHKEGINNKQKDWKKGL